MSDRYFGTHDFNVVGAMPGTMNVLFRYSDKIMGKVGKRVRVGYVVLMVKLSLGNAVFSRQ